MIKMWIFDEKQKCCQESICISVEHAWNYRVTEEI